MTRTPLRLAGLVALAAVLAGLLAPAPAATATTAARTTTFTLVVTGCEGCRVTPFWHPSASEPGDDWTGPTHGVRHGVVRFAIPRRYVALLSFKVRDPRAVRPLGVPVLALRYDERRPGQPVTARQARRARVASTCFAGTRRDHVRLPVTVDRYAGRDHWSGRSGYRIRPYADPGVATYDGGYPILLEHGQVPTTDNAWTCGR